MKREVQKPQVSGRVWDSVPNVPLALCPPIVKKAASHPALGRKAAFAVPPKFRACTRSLSTHHARFPVTEENRQTYAARTAFSLRLRGDQPARLRRSLAPPLPRLAFPRGFFLVIAGICAIILSRRPQAVKPYSFEKIALLPQTLNKFHATG